MTEFNLDLYFALMEKITVNDGGRLIVSLLDGTDLERDKLQIVVIVDEKLLLKKRH